MPDPITLAAVGSVALTEGVKFLYGQAGELLKRWRERKDAASKAERADAERVEPVDVQLPEAFAGQLTTPKIHYGTLEQVRDELSEARKELLDYAEGLKDLDPGDEILLSQVDALRRLLEAVYQQRITFKGEQRAESGPVTEGRIDAREVAGHAAAVRAKKIKGGTVRGLADVDRVGPGGKLYGVQADEIG